MGTENRAPAEEYIPPQEQPYDYIVFRAAEVANLALDIDPRPVPRAVFNDPAVLSVSEHYLASCLRSRRTRTFFLVCALLAMTKDFRM